MALTIIRKEPAYLDLSISTERKKKKNKKEMNKKEETKKGEKRRK